MLTDLRERLTRAFAEVYAANVPWFGGGGPGYYGIRLEDVSPDGAEVTLVVTFRSGVRYCCFESAGHFAYYRRLGWERLRAALDRQGLAHLPLPTIRRLRGVIEAGAVMTPNRVSPAYVSEASEYEIGPFWPVSWEPGEPTI